MPLPRFHLQGLAGFGLTIWLGLTVPFAALGEDTDARTKAAYLHNFTKFVEWPKLENDTVHICVVGSEAVVNLLGEIASRDLKGHALQIWFGMDDPQICQILFIHGDKDIAHLLNQVRGNNVLTVGDATGFTRQGGSIGFYTEEGQIKLEINPDAVRDAHLKLNAMLMEIARIVR